MMHPNVFAALTDIAQTLGRMTHALAAGTWAPFLDREWPRPVPQNNAALLNVPPLLDTERCILSEFGLALSVLAVGFVRLPDLSWDSVGVSDAFIQALGWGRSQSPADRAGFNALDPFDQRSYRAVLDALETLGPWISFATCPSFQHKGPRDLVRDIVARSIYLHRGAPPPGYTVSDPRGTSDATLCLGHERDSSWTNALNLLDDMWFYSSTAVSAHAYSRGRHARPQAAAAAPAARLAPGAPLAQSPRGGLRGAPQALANSPHTHRLDGPPPQVPIADRFWYSGALARLVPDPRTLTDQLLALAIDTQDLQTLEDVVSQLNRLGIHQSR